MDAAAALHRKTFSAYAGRTILAIGAHPDDVELTVGGTVARWTRAGCRVVIAIVSIPSQYSTRRREAERAAAILGCELRILAEGGRRIEDLRACDLVALLDAQVKDLSPAAMLVHGRADFHRDHLLVHRAAVSSQRLLQFDCFRPSVYVDITDTIDLKMAAIDAHQSQFRERSISTDVFREIARVNGWRVGVSYAEGLEIERMVIC